jgi:hypothetical protein
MPLCPLYRNDPARTRIADASCAAVVPAGNTSAGVLSCHTTERGQATRRPSCVCIGTAATGLMEPPTPTTAGARPQGCRHQQRRPITSCRITVIVGSSGQWRIIKRCVAVAIHRRRPASTVGSVGDRTARLNAHMPHQITPFTGARLSVRRFAHAPAKFATGYAFQGSGVVAPLRFGGWRGNVAVPWTRCASTRPRLFHQNCDSGKCFHQIAGK